MSADKKFDVVLAWHMHQPEYRDLPSGRYQLPWTYLHAIKDYTDMAAHLENWPDARVVVNFAPLLLEQLADYTQQIETFFREGRPLRDPLLAALAQAVLPAAREERLALVRACLRANDTRMIARFQPYQRLAEMARWLLSHPDGMAYVSEEYIVDLLMWYHLAWLGETVRRADVRVRKLMDKASRFDLQDRRQLLELIGELIANVVPRYKRLAQRGQVELSVTPYAHPMLPLLIDFESAHEALPHAALPAVAHYPDGEERARWHVREGVRVFEQHFGFRPTGCWPSEGGVSERALRMLAQEGLHWAATGEGVLRNSLSRFGELPPEKRDWLYRPYTLSEHSPRVFFRDDRLSDLIGFSYATWHADDAVADLIAHLERVADACEGHDGAVASIILDGENAWEHYPENAYYFLNALYKRLSEHPRLRLTTFGDYAAATQPLRLLASGSWVYGNFSTWIGDVDKNRGWEMLCDAKRAYDTALPNLSEADRDVAQRQLAVCEGSDWFWWFGDYNPSDTVSDFEGLYRRHLLNLYAALRLEPPDYLGHTFTRGQGAPALGGAMRRSSDHTT